MRKYEFTDEKQNYIRHSAKPRFIIEVIREPPEDWAPPHQYFIMQVFNGHKFIFVLHTSEVELPQIKESAPYFRALEKAWKWYRSQVYMPRSNE